MDNQHFVYAITNGSYDVNGNPVIIFGRSTLKTFAGRCRNYNTTAPVPPKLIGVIRCDTKEHAKNVEHAVLFRTSSDAFPENRNVEIRSGSDDVLNFIETEMEDGEAFLGMPAIEFANAKAREYQAERRKDPKYRERRAQWEREREEKDPDYKRRQKETYERKWNDPEYRENRRRKQRERKKSPEARARANARKRERYRNDPEYRKKQNERRRKHYELQKRGGNSDGQLTIF